MPTFFEELTVGKVNTSAGYTITKTEIVEFAEQFDPQPFHTDEAAAKDLMFDGLVVSGLHTLCLAIRLALDGFLGDVANMGGRRMDEIRWYKLVPLQP